MVVILVLVEFVFQLNSTYEDWYLLGCERNLKGVTKRRQYNTYHVYMKEGKKIISFGTFKTLNDAVIFNNYLKCFNYPGYAIRNKHACKDNFTNKIHELIINNRFELPKS